MDIAEGITVDPPLLALRSTGKIQCGALVFARGRFGMLEARMTSR